MLATLNDVLPAAQKGGYAVGLFNAVNLEMAMAVLAAAERERSPVIIGPAEILLHHCPLGVMAGMLLPAIRRATVPVVLHFDHGLSRDVVIEALRCGFSSVMLDRSTAPYEQNVADCREMAAIAHAFGASIEAELGHVGSGAAGSAESAGGDDHGVYTQPAEAAAFVRETGVDALAVAIGTAHGTYREAPRLDFARLGQIRAATAVPLVLHGGSGLSDEDFLACIKGGIAKINIFTESDETGAAAASAALEDGAKTLTGLLPAVTKAITNSVAAKMRLFGSAGRA